MRSSSTSLPVIRETHTSPELTNPPAWIDSADFHLFEADDRFYLLVADGSRVFGIDSTIADFLRDETCSDLIRERLREVGIMPVQAVGDPDDRPMPIRSLSLAVSQKCNLGCTYCYAEGGSFGGPARVMTLEVARASVDRMFESAESGARFNLSFLGGEPLSNRDVLRKATEYAVQMANDREARLGLSITTNGTMLTPDDAAFFEKHGFAVTISLDGIGKTHDALRPYKSGRGSYGQIVENVKPLLRLQTSMQVSARVTVTPRNLCLLTTLNELLALNFHSVGFSPMLSSPTGVEQLGQDELDEMLTQMIECGREFEKRLGRGERWAFSNMANALREIHQGTHRPYPCGAGGSYFGVSADGGLYACHRFIDDPDGKMGDVETGVDPEVQRRWLGERHVHLQEPCSSCWAKYLCGGGCHHEVIRRGRPACHYIRGWLHYCLEAYVRLLDKHPEFFGSRST